MKKLGTLAIGTLLFFAVSCNKNKTSLEPKTETSYAVAPSDIRDDENINHTNSTLRMEENGPDTKVPVRGVRNDEEVNPWNDHLRTEQGPVKNRVRNDEQVNPNTQSEKKGVRPHNEYEIPTIYNPSKIAKPGVRNDEQVNPNTSDL